jgi:peptidoglycan hydrolase-like protein with peptidoglycan-binding domain
MAEISRLILLIGTIVALGACSDEQLPPVDSRVTYPQNHAIVREVQISLRKRGYYAGIIDGFLGQDTAIAIQRFQMDHGQTVKPVIERPLLVSLGIRNDR